MIKKFIIAILFTLVLCAGASAELLEYDCDSPDFGGVTYTKEKRIIDIEKKIMKQEVEGYANDNNFTYDNKSEIEIIDDETIKFFSTNRSMYDWQMTVYQNMSYDYNNPKKFKKLEKKYGSIDQRRAEFTWFYKKDLSEIPYVIYATGDKSVSSIKCRLLNKTALAAIAEKKAKKIMENKAKKLIENQKMCEEIGFTPKTENFANCILKLIELDEIRQAAILESESRASLETKMQKQAIEIQKQIAEESKASRDQKAWEILLGLSMGNSSILNSPTSNSRTCFKSSETTSGLSKICYYNCGGTTRALNVNSTQLCPLNANL